jgi:hypothetical protein
MKQSKGSRLDAQIDEARRRIAELEADIIRCSEIQSDEAIAADRVAPMQLELQLGNYLNELAIVTFPNGLALN